jgi:hypothetical protein
VKVASRRSFLRALPTESTLTFAESLGGTSTTSSPAPTSFCATGRPMPAAPSTAQRRSGNRFDQCSSACRPLRSAGKAMWLMISPFSSMAATAFALLWGSTPMSTFILPNLLRVWGHYHRGVRRTIRLRVPVWPTPLLGHPARRASAGHRPIASQPCTRAAGASRAIPTDALEA